MSVNTITIEQINKKIAEGNYIKPNITTNIDSSNYDKWKKFLSSLC